MILRVYSNLCIKNMYLTCVVSQLLTPTKSAGRFQRAPRCRAGMPRQVKTWCFQECSGSWCMIQVDYVTPPSFRCYGYSTFVTHTHTHKKKQTRYFYTCQDLFKEMQEHCFVERLFNYVKTSPEPLELGWVFPSSWIAGARIRKHVSPRIWTLGNITPLRNEPSFISFNHSGFGFWGNVPTFWTLDSFSFTYIEF